MTCFFSFALKVSVRRCKVHPHTHFLKQSIKSLVRRQHFSTMCWQKHNANWGTIWNCWAAFKPVEGAEQLCPNLWPLKAKEGGWSRMNQLRMWKKLSSQFKKAEIYCTVPHRKTVQPASNPALWAWQLDVGPSLSGAPQGPRTKGRPLCSAPLPGKGQAEARPSKLGFFTIA